MSNYINNKEFLQEIKVCRSNGSCSDKLASYFVLLANHLAYRLKYAEPMDREDCVANAICDMVKYWNRFDPEKSSNAFAYFSQIAKFGMAKQWNILHPEKYKGTISLDYFWTDPDSKSYNTI